MATGSKRLVRYGFLSKDGEAWRSKEGKGWKELKDEELQAELKKLSDNDAEKFADHQEIEIAKDQIVLQDVPKPESCYYLIHESFNNPIEPLYYGALGTLQHGLGFPIVWKLKDLFAASEQSSYYGAAGQRLSLAQDKVSTFLATLGQMIKRDLFQLVRDLRWLDERLDIHKRAREPKNFEPAETALKGIWVDLVDGVVQNQRVAPNILQLAQQVGFTTLPTLFFNTSIRVQPKDQDAMEAEIKKWVGRVAPNAELKSILLRKFEEYLTWRERNYEDLALRKEFELKYLRQQYHIIKLYANWLKPYMRQIERMTTETGKLASPELVQAFEGSMVEIEILGQRLPDKNKDVYGCLLLSFEYRTRPSLSFQIEGGFHRGPIHVGESKITWRAYAWDVETVDRFKKLREREDLEQMALHDVTIQQTLDAMGADLEKYLKQAEERFGEGKKEEKAGKRESVFEPFLAVFRGVKELFWEPFIPAKGKGGPSAVDKAKQSEEKKAAAGLAKKMLYVHYKTFKKSNGMHHW